MARWMGKEEWWNTLAYSWSVPVSMRIKQLVVKQVLKSDHGLITDESSPDHIINSRGRAAVRSRRLYEDLDWSVSPDQLSLEQSILVWHIATNIYLFWYNHQQQQEELARLQALAEAAEALSNYMLFLLAARTSMLPTPASRNVYVEVCYCLTSVPLGAAEDFVCFLWHYGEALNTGTQFEFDFGNPHMELEDCMSYNETLKRGSRLGAKLIGHELEHAPAADMLELIAQVWAEMLCYAGHRCSAYSHAKQLSNGGELVTVAAILVEHLRRQSPQSKNYDGQICLRAPP